MKTPIFLGVVVAALFVGGVTAQAQGPLAGRLLRGGGMQARGHSWAQSQAESQPWHGQHYYLQYGQPTALVVPPTGIMQQTYSWGVSQNKNYPVYHQFGESATPSAGGHFYATPPWPSNTRQFGVYPVRAPW